MEEKKNLTDEELINIVKLSIDIIDQFNKGFTEIDPQKAEEVSKFFDEYSPSVPKEDNGYDKDSILEDNSIVNKSRQILLSYKNRIVEPNTRIQNTLFSPDVSNFFNNQRAFAIDENKRKKGGEAKLYLDEEGGKAIENLGIIADDPYLCGVEFNAICCYIDWEPGQPIIFPEDKRPFITHQMIYSRISKYKTKTITPRMQSLIHQIFDTFRRNFLYLDYSEHAIANGLPEGNYVRNENIINAVYESKIINGQKVDGWSIISVPSLLQYAKEVKQLTTMDIYNIPIETRDNITKIKLRSYLDRFIANYKNSKKNITYVTLTYEKLFKNCCIVHTSRTQMNRDKDFITKTLLQAYWEEGIIVDYHEIEDPNHKQKTRRKLLIQLRGKEGDCL